MAQIGRAVLVGRRADGDEHHLGRRDGGGDVGRELEPALLLIALDERIEPGLVDREDVLLQTLDLRDSTSAQ